MAADEDDQLVFQRQIRKFSSRPVMEGRESDFVHAAAVGIAAFCTAQDQDVAGLQAGIAPGNDLLVIAFNDRKDRLRRKGDFTDRPPVPWMS